MTPSPTPAASRFDPAPAASQLAAAWRAGRQLTELPEAMRPRTLTEGYDLQEAFIASMGDAAGWKLGVGSPAAMRGAGLERPLVGRVLASRLHRAGEAVKMPSRAPVTVEFEVAFVLARDIAPGETLHSPLDAVSAAHVTFELVLSRFANRRAVGWPSFAGDSVGFEALVVGSPIDLARVDAVAASAVVSVDGVATARGLAGDEFTDPVRSLGYLLEHAAERGVTLARGQIVTTGAAAKPFDLAGRDAEVAARYLDAELRFRIEMPGASRQA
jgi:2-keto-4-pentenoate hydratase